MDSPELYDLREHLVGFLEDQGHRPRPTRARRKPRRNSLWDLVRSRRLG